MLEAEADWATAWGDGSEYRDLTAEEIAELECVLGEETIVPSPDKEEPEAEEPTVLGTQAAVPSAVAAGLRVTADRGSATTALALLLTGGGLVLVVAGGWAGVRAREPGEHSA